MPTGTYVRKNAVRDRLKAGMAANHAEDFAQWLRERRYTPLTIIERERLLACWTHWADAEGYTLDAIREAYAASFALIESGDRPCFRGDLNKDSVECAKLFINYLRERGVLPPAERRPSPEETWPILAAFRRWMREQRGLMDSTLDHYQLTLVDLLAILGDDPSTYTAVNIRNFVLNRAKPHGRGRAQSITVATRAFLRYLVATGQCPVGWDHAVPSFASWELATTPRFLSAPDLSRVIAACDGEDRLRDRAVILLLARLGLRASEVANLGFAQIDWTNGYLTITGKTRREERLPLPQEVGDALISYIERARPQVATARIFLTDVAPIRPLSRVAVKCIVRRALDRAEVDSPHRGAHVLRHSAATAMLRNGVSLAGVGAVLRHRSPSMTALYAKVDIALLSEIAQPWGGRLPC